MLEQHFGESEPWSVGIEEELFVVHAETLLPARVPAHLLDGAHRKPELFRSLIELATGICSAVEAAVAELRALRAAVSREAAAAGLQLFAAGTHPLAVPDEQELTDEPGLAAFAAYAGPAVRVQYCCGLHVHVGVPGADDCIGRLEAVLPWLPVLLAASANSPFLAGRESGLASTRAELLTRLPRTGAPPAFGSYAGWETYAERLVRLGLADDYRRTWWDVRPHPRLGTLELRIPDQPTSLEVTAAFAAVAQALVVAAEPALTADRGIYDQNRFAAMRFGAGAELIHPDGTRLAGVPELIEELLGRIRPVAERLGTARLLEPLERLARRTQADEQLALAGDVGLRGVAGWLVAETGPSTMIA
jgi:carboxylate-amine ligase